MSLSESLQDVIAALRGGGVIAYPTEAVWGLGCDPANAAAVERLLALKQRDMAKGLILVAADLAQVESLLHGLDSQQRQRVLASWPGPHTWVVPVSADFPLWVRGQHDSVALRVSAHAGVQALCRAFGGPLVSTSANRSGAAPALDEAGVRQQFGGALAAIFPGAGFGCQCRSHAGRHARRSGH